MTVETFAGIDIGGTKIALGLGSLEGPPSSLTRFHTELELGPHNILDAAIKRLEEMAQDIDSKIMAVGVCCGGPLNRQKGLILSPPQPSALG